MIIQKLSERPLLVEAVEIIYRHPTLPTNVAEIAEWCGGSTDTGHRLAVIAVPTLDGGVALADPGDWVVRNGLGDFSVLSPDALGYRYQTVP